MATVFVIINKVNDELSDGYDIDVEDDLGRLVKEDHFGAHPRDSYAPGQATMQQVLEWAKISVVHIFEECFGREPTEQEIEISSDDD